MADLIKITANKRTGEKPRATRHQSQIPGVMYGPGLGEGKSLAVAMLEGDFVRAFRAAGHNTLLELEVDNKKHEVLIHEVQRHSVKNQILHFDFFAVKRGEKITTEIPLKFLNEEKSEAVRAGGALNTPLDALEVKVLPKDLVSEFEVDLTKLAEIGQQLTIADLDIDAQKFELSLEPDTLIATTAEIQEEEIPEDTIVKEAPKAPPPPKKKKKPEIFKIVEQMPRFPGCEDKPTKAEKEKCAQAELYKFIYDHLKYPTIAQENGIEGKVFLRFAVDDKGKVSQVTILRDIGGNCGEAAAKVIRKMNDSKTWIPGRQGGRKVSVWYTLPIVFKLTG